MHPISDSYISYMPVKLISFMLSFPKSLKAERTLIVNTIRFCCKADMWI